MQIHVDLASHLAADAGIGTSKIVQASPDPAYGGRTTVGGQFIIPTVDGTTIPVDNTSYVLPIDGGDISSRVFAALLARYPQYQHIYFNPLIRAIDLADLDLAASFTISVVLSGNPNPSPVSFQTRAKIGKYSGVPAHDGIAPNNVALLPVNSNAPDPGVPSTFLARPGVLITKQIDLTAATVVGADDFLVYWKFYRSTTSHDIAGANAVGATANQNTPALRSLQEVDQEPIGMLVYLSPDNGQTWQSVGRMEQLAFCAKVPNVRLAFVNYTSSPILLTHFALLF